MADPAVRIAIVLGVVAVALVIAAIIRRTANPPHPDIRVGSGASFPGVVLFTSTTCATCTETIELLQSAHIPYREITEEIESHRFDEWGVVAVPLTVVLDVDGGVDATFSGVPKRRRLESSLDRTGIAYGA